MCFPPPPRTHTTVSIDDRYMLKAKPLLIIPCRRRTTLGTNVFFSVITTCILQPSVHIVLFFKMSIGDCLGHRIMDQITFISSSTYLFCFNTLRNKSKVYRWFWCVVISGNHWNLDTSRSGTNDTWPLSKWGLKMLKKGHRSWKW